MKVLWKTVVLCLSLSGFLYASRKGEIIEINKIDFQNNTPDVTLSLTIKGMSNVSLDESCFTVIDDGNRVNHLSLQKESHASGIIYIVVSIDSSKSLSEKGLKEFKKKAGEIVQSSGNAFNFGIWKFNNEVVIINDFSSKRNDLQKAVESIVRHGNKTLLYDAIYKSIDHLSKEEGRGKGLIVFTDGKDEGSGVTADDVISFAREKGIAVHFVTLKNSKFIQTIERIAKMSKGTVSFNEDAGVGKRIISEMGQYGYERYLLKYRKPNTDVKASFVEIQFKKDDKRDTVSFQKDYPESGFPDKYFKYVIYSVFGIIIVLLLIIILLIVKKGTSQKKENQIIATVQSPVFPITEKYIEKEERTQKSYRGWLLEKEGPETGKKFPLFWDNVTIGRDPSNAIVVNDSAVSLKHVRIRNNRKTFYIIDLASENGTLLNGKKLLRVKKLSDWDEIAIGKTQFIFRSLQGRV